MSANSMVGARPVQGSGPAEAAVEGDGSLELVRRHGADLAALSVSVIWGVSFIFQKAALEEIGPLAFTFLRYVGMMALGWGVLLWQRRGGVPVGVAWSDLPRLVLTGVLGYTLYILLSTVALSYTTAFSNALLIGTAPLFAMLLLRLWRLERTGPEQVVAMLVCFAGVLVFLTDKIHLGSRSAGMGDLISLVGAFFFAAYSVVHKPLLARYPVSVVMAYALTFGAVPILCLALPATLGQEWASVSSVAWAGLAWSIVVPVYVAWTIWGWAIARAGVARTSMFMYLVPIAGGVASWILLDEGFGIMKVVGAALTLGGLILARSKVEIPASRREDA